MQAEIESIEKQLAIAIDRCQINQIVCVNYECQRNNTTLEEVNEYLNLDNKNKINADLLYFFNDLHDLHSEVVTDIKNEEEAIEIQIKESIKSIESKSFRIAEEKNYNFELNNCFVKLFEKINTALNDMNYYKWIGRKNPNVNKEVLYLLLNNKHETFIKFAIEIDKSDGQKNQLVKAFNFRREKLKDLKDAILEIYAKVLYSPSYSAIPEYEYSCSKVDICELAYAIQLSNTVFNEPALVAQTILKMFKISKDDYSKAQGEIRKRKKAISTFTKKLSEKIEALKST
jgi:hypothetical protein